MADTSRTVDADDDVGLKTKEVKQNAPASLRTEVARRQEMHTLAEHHEHLLSASFDLSNGSGGAPGPSSSQISQDFVFDNNFLNLPSGGLLDFEGLGDELEKELGWGPSQAGIEELFVQFLSTCLYVGAYANYSDLNGDFQMGGLGSGIDFDFDWGQMPFTPVEAMSPTQNATTLQKTPQNMKRKKTLSVSDKGWSMSAFSGLCFY
jgi:hypothetical protein